MLNTIGDSLINQALRVQQVIGVGEKEGTVQKTTQASVPRPVEKTDESRQSEMHLKDDEKVEITNRNRIEDGQVVLEKYDRNGKLLKKVPPGYVPFGEIA